MKLNRMVAYSLMTAGAVGAAGCLARRLDWEEVNVSAGIMLDWDDVQAVATRAVTALGPEDDYPGAVAMLLERLRDSGATHLALPELTLRRLLDRGDLSLASGASPNRLYLQARQAGLADRVAAELSARLPGLRVIRSGAKTPVISLLGDLPALAEVGLGFDPAMAGLARRVGLAPVARPIGYSWVQPEMIERTLDQAAALGARIVAVQGNLIPGHEFKIRHTAAAMRRSRLTYAYFSQSRHQKGDWFLAKQLAPAGLVILAHEFEPAEMLEDDWYTLSGRWANLAVEAGIRLCSVRFFRVLHAADPLEALEYVRELARALTRAGLVLCGAGAVDLTPYYPAGRDDRALAAAGLSIAGAAGLAADWLPLPEPLKLAGLGVGALVLAGLPFLERRRGPGDEGHHHEHNHDHHHHHHNGHEPDHHHHDHEPGHHHHDHDHGHHEHDHEPGPSHGPALATAYAPKGLALAAGLAFPAAVLAGQELGPGPALAQSLAVSAAGAAALAATTTEGDYLLAIESYRGAPLDWLGPLAGAALAALRRPAGRPGWPQLLAWLPLAGLALLSRRGGADLLGSLDREHRHAHTHHLSAFQRLLGDTRLALSPRPLRKWTLLAPLGAVGAALLRQNDRVAGLAPLAQGAAVAGQMAALAGFRAGQRPLARTLAGRARSWAIGGLLAGLAWLGLAWLNRRLRR